jgi:hypothetical protein
MPLLILKESQLIVRLIVRDISLEYQREIIENANDFIISLMNCTHNLPVPLQFFLCIFTRKAAFSVVVFFVLLKI